jgi:gliding motility-associated-like protein
MIKVAFNFAGVHAGVEAEINGVIRDTSGCVPLKVDFTDTIQNAESYEWDFGDGSPRVTTTDPTTSHIFNNVGFYRVMLIAIDPNSCNLRDTAYTHIRVGNNQGNPAFTSERLLPCGSFKFRFNNTSTAPNGPAFSNTAFVWDFGDNTPRQTAGLGTVDHQYSAPGSYVVKLYLVDTNYCNAPDSITQTVRISPKLKAQFQAPANGCAPSAVTFKNTSNGGQQFTWNFGDGTTLQTTDEVVNHIYTTPGNYTVTLIALDPEPCYDIDSAKATITVYNKPTADFTASPQPPTLNTPITFTNLSTSAIRYKWLFGDGDSLATTATQPFSHDYNITGTYNACLIAYNANGCTDTTCKPVQVIVATSVDVPNAFTPLSTDINSQVAVRGYGIAKMRFIIWNRWGQKMFETNSKRDGWDGRYKGVLQPMDVYAYTLEVEFADGQKVTKKGDITLIR